jgi:polysaccharide biosynthesis protein PslH
MRILMVSSYLPYPLLSGGQVRLYNLIKELSGKHQITLICEKRSNQTGRDVEEVEKICKKVITVERRRQWGFRNIAKTAFSKNSFLVTGHTHQEMRQKIKEELKKEKFDLIHVETFYVMQNLPQVLLPVVLAEHNIEYQVYKRFVDRATALVKPLLMLDIAKLKREEEGFWKKAARLIAVSESDAAIMREYGLDPEIVSNGVDVEKFSKKQEARSKKQKEAKILFIGDFKWLQNRDAATWIVKDIWPLIQQKARSKKQKANLWIVGREIPESIKSLTNDSSIIFDEETSKKPTEQIFQEADLLLAPIRVGGGTSYKILEAMSCGTPVVTMPMSAEAIGAGDGESIAVGKTEQELAEKVVRVLSDQDFYKKLAINGRKLIEERYTWKKIANDLENIYKNVA